MDELKLKFKLLINKQNRAQGQWRRASTSFEGDGTGESVILPANRDTVANLGVHLKSTDLKELDDQTTDQEILKSIEQIYFVENDFDLAKYELKKLSATLQCDEIQRNLKVLNRQRAVVLNQALQLILKQQPSCQKEFERIVEIQDKLKSSVESCKSGRSQLNIAKQQFTTASLGLLANYRKRQRAVNLLKSLSSIKTLQCTKEQLQDLLREGDFAGAINLLIECQSVASTFRHFKCVAALNSQLQDTLEMAEESLDQALANSCLDFKSEVYTKLQDAYSLLGKSQIAADQLLMHFYSAVQNISFSTVSNYLQPNILGASKKSYPELCKFISKENFVPCLTELCKSLWNIACCYREVSKWHMHKIPKSPSRRTETVEVAMATQHIKQKLEKGRSSIWQDMQSKVASLIIACDPSNYKFDEFLCILDLVDKLARVGEEFCENANSIDLQNAARSQSLSYLRSYHQARLDELCMFLENEGWAHCPVRSNFNALQLQEFRWAVSFPEVSKSRLSSSISSSSSIDGFFSRHPRSSNSTPFDLKSEMSVEEDFFTSNGNNSSDDSDDDTNGRIGHTRERHTVLVANTTLSVLRLIGRYLWMMHLLQPIALDILRRLTQLFDLYLYVIHSFFAKEKPSTREFEYTYQLQSNLLRIKENLIIKPGNNQETLEFADAKVTPPELSPIVNLDSPEDLHGLAECVVAVESLSFLANQVLNLRSQIQGLLPSDQWPALDHFYSQVSVAEDLRKPIYMNIAWHAVDLRQLLTQMSKVNWEVRDVMSLHSPYVDFILRELQIFSMRLSEISKRTPIPKSTKVLLWQFLSHLVCNAFVEGFSNAKKCSNGGRGLMQLDFTQFASKLEKLAELRPIPGKDIVEQYIKAYYLPEPALETWIRSHKEYSGRQLAALVNCACQNNKRVRHVLLGLIEELGY
ncbi:syndetin [Neocloeon triangulifer]|uniref:syndetin n=1 Tax=Neocloeon triangulifer TaxID=2078957 RepID=UPI00286F19BA|nr:syndetin [Neocloeon triangulifer]XP_059490609.1 syndetin [Neocloeon triangulifer]